MPVVNFMSAFPYGREKLAPRFEDPLDAVKARLLELLKADTADAVTLKDLKLKYGSKFGRQDMDSITVGRLKSMPQLEVRNLGGFEVRVALHSRRRPTYAAAEALAMPLPASLDISYIHPCVHTTLENLKERLHKAVETYAPYGIPYNKIVSGQIRGGNHCMQKVQTYFDVRISTCMQKFRNTSILSCVRTSNFS